MLKFDEQKQIESVNGALALRPQIEEIVDQIQDYDAIYWIGIGGTWASCMQVEVYMRHRSSILAVVENEYSGVNSITCPAFGNHHSA